MLFRSLDDARAVMRCRVERVDERGRGDRLFPAAAFVRDAGLAERVEAPGVDGAEGVDGKRVVGAAADEDDILKREAFGSEAVGLVACVWLSALYRTRETTRTHAG